MPLPFALPLAPDDIAAIERATLAAVAPRLIEEFPDWLLPHDDGAILRARAAVPLSHERCDEDILPILEARYAA